MEQQTYYQVLGVETAASADEIKRAYRTLARKYHPDVSEEKDAEEQMKAINQAYETLSDPQQRAQYDRFGQYAHQQGQPQQPYGQGSYQQNGQTFYSFEDIFAAMFEQQRRQQQYQRTQPQRRNVSPIAKFIQVMYYIMIIRFILSILFAF